MENGTPKTIWMFSGQGSQYYQMGRELYEKNALFREELQKADRIASRMINESLLEIIYRPREDRFEPFARILYTHPALLMIEYALARVLLQSRLSPDALLGYSLGELTCMVVAGAVSFEEAMVVVVKMAELLDYCAPAGRMLAVLHSPELIERHPEAFEECEIAAFNFPNNFIVTGPVEAVSRLQRFLAGQEISTKELPVAHPFHSSKMAGMKAPLQAVARQITYDHPRIPILSARNGEPLETCSPMQLMEAMSCRVDFTATVKELERSEPHLYIDLGPSGSMVTSVKYNLSEESSSELLSVITPFGQEVRNLDRLMARLNPG